MAKVTSTAHASNTCIYTYVPAKPLPVIDLSKSLRGELLTRKANTVIHRFLSKYHRSLLLANATAFCLICFVVVVSASTGQILSLISIFLWFPLGFGALSTLRYDIVRLLMGTFDFWFFSFVTSMTVALVSEYFRDLRFLRMIIDWVGFHHIVCIDAHVRGVRQFALMTIVGIPPVLFMLVWIMLGHVDGCTSFSILNYESAHHTFHVSGVDMIGNGLLTLALFITKIAIRKRRALRDRRSLSVIQCVIYRCALRLVPITDHSATAKQERRTGIRRRAAGANTAKRAVLRETNIIQKLRFVKSTHTFNAFSTLFPVRVTGVTAISGLYLLPLYVCGVFGIGLSFSVLLGGFNNGTERTLVLVQAWSSLLWTLAFVIPFAALYQRQLLKMLVTSFDYIFYAFQITAANLSICVLCKWELSRCLMVLTWEIWFLWALTLDALTPVMKDKLRMRPLYAAPVVALMLVGHLAIMNRNFFVGDEALQDTIFFEGVVWDHPLVVRAMPFYFSRIITLSLWCPRLVWRLIMASRAEMVIIRGAVCYNNYFSRQGRQRSGASPPTLDNPRKRTHRRDQIAPAVPVNNYGPRFSALIAPSPP